MTDLGAVLSPGVVQALEALIDERVERALAAHGDTVNGSSPWLTLRQAAERLHVSERTVARMTKRGRIRTSCIGRRVLVHTHDLDAHVRGDA